MPPAPAVISSTAPERVSFPVSAVTPAARIPIGASSESLPSHSRAALPVMVSASSVLMMAPVCSVSAAAALMVPFRVRGLAVRVIHCPGRCPRRVFQNVLAIRAGNGLAADRKRIIFHIGVASAANGTVRADDAHTNRQVMGIDRQRIPLCLRPLKLDLFRFVHPNTKVESRVVTLAGMVMLSSFRHPKKPKILCSSLYPEPPHWSGHCKSRMNLARWL